MIDVGMREPNCFRNELVRLDKIKKSLLLVESLTSRINNSASTCFCVNYIGIFLEWVKAKDLMFQHDGNFERPKIDPNQVFLRREIRFENMCSVC